MLPDRDLAVPQNAAKSPEDLGLQNKEKDITKIQSRQQAEER